MPTLIKSLTRVQGSDLISIQAIWVVEPTPVSDGASDSLRIGPGVANKLKLTK